MAYSHGYVKRNFFTGQFDREFSGQENAITAAGMVHCKNVLTSPQGECKARPGTEHLGSLGKESVLIPYRRAGQDLVLVFSDSQLDVKTFDEQGNLKDFVPATLSEFVWTNTGNNTPADTPVSITGQISGNTSLAYKFWSESVYNLTSGYETNRLYIPQQTYPTTYFNMQFTGEVGAKALNRLSFEILPANGNWDASYLKVVKNWINNAVLQYSNDGTNWFTARLVRPVYWQNKTESTVAGERPVPRLRFDMLETAQHEYWRVVVVWNRQQMDSNAPFLVHFADVQEEIPGQVTTLTSPYTVDVLKKLKYSQQWGQLIICDGVHNPYMFSMTGNSISFIEKTYDFITNDGVPSCVRFFQNRLYYGGFATYPTRVRGSRFATNAEAQDYSDFTVETENVTVASPICVECNQFNERITDLWGGFNILYAQSADGIAFVEGMTVTPSFTLRCSERASGITPTMKDNFMYYVGYDRRKIHAFSFDNNIQQFVAPDISRYWQEVLKNRVAEIHYVDSRSKCVIGSLEDGTGFFLFHEGGDVGYFPFDIGGFISDLSVVKDGDDTHVLAVVQRGETWNIERFHMPEFMRSTNAFEQSGWDRNLATQENLKKSPFFDSWRVIKDERIELWQYKAESQTIIPAADTGVPTNLAEYVGKTIRCYYGDGIRDYTDVTIDRVFTAQETVEKEIEVSENVTYYGWTNVNAIIAAPKQGVEPSVSGRFVRYPSAESAQSSLYFIQNNTVVSVGRGKKNVYVGDTIYKSDGIGGVQVGFVQSIEQDVYFTKSLILSEGDPVYDSNYNQVGSITSVGINSFVFDGTTYYKDSRITTTRTETHTETIEVAVEPGEYAVDCSLTEDTIFNKIQLPIDEFLGTEPVIQIQDNGVYKGEINGTDAPRVLYAWAHNSDRVYTSTLSPEVGDNVYSIVGIKIGTIKNVNGNNITVKDTVYQLQTSTPQQMDLYAWSTAVSIDFYKTTPDPDGQFRNVTRNTIRDLLNTADRMVWYAWNWRSMDIYTQSPIPQPNDNVYDSSFNIIGYVTDTIGLSTCYTATENIEAGAVIYNSNGVVTGSVSFWFYGGYLRSAEEIGYKRNSTLDTQTTVYVPVDPVTNIMPYTYTLKESMYDIQYGVPYRKIGVVEDNRSYLRQKGWGAIAFNIIDTMALKVGIKLDKLTNMIKWDGKQFFDSNLIMKNGTLICNIKDVPQYEKQLIFMTDEGLPFTVLAIETAGEISDRGAN